MRVMLLILSARVSPGKIRVRIMDKRFAGSNASDCFLPLSVSFAAKTICQLARERSSLLKVVRLEVSRRDSDTEIALTVFSAAEEADQRQERKDLASSESEMDAIDVFAPLPGSDLLHRLQVVAPVTSADHEGGEVFPIKKPLRQVGFHERANRHAGRQPPGRGTNADEVVLAVLRLGGTRISPVARRSCAGSIPAMSR
jgi:hypothetical protein